MHVGGTSCDLVKGFDCINYEMLLLKLIFYGISKTSVNLKVWCDNKTSKK
jgi:hypothetical protein